MLPQLILVAFTCFLINSRYFLLKYIKIEAPVCMFIKHVCFWKNELKHILKINRGSAVGSICFRHNVLQPMGFDTGLYWFLFSSNSDTIKPIHNFWNQAVNKFRSIDLLFVTVGREILAEPCFITHWHISGSLRLELMDDGDLSLLIPSDDHCISVGHNQYTHKQPSNLTRTQELHKCE